MIELFAITNAPAPAAGGLHAVESNGLAALCAEAGERAVSVEDLWRRQELLEALMEECSLLPVRYGTTVGDESEAERFLAARHEALVQALERVEGAVELAVRVGGANEEASTDAAAYVRVKARLLELHDALAAVARDDRRLAPWRSAFLVPRDEIDMFLARVAAIEQANEDLSLLCTGPWPPYSFAEQ